MRKERKPSDQTRRERLRAALREMKESERAAREEAPPPRPDLMYEPAEALVAALMLGCACLSLLPQILGWMLAASIVLRLILIVYLKTRWGSGLRHQFEEAYDECELRRERLQRRRKGG
ncbi:MAG: hypothetical protein ACYCUM_07470 [Solirubrobacteraceae bacterium]